LLELFDLEADELPAIAEAFDLAGVLHRRGAALTGLPEGTPVAVGTGDDFSNPLGAGLVEPGRLACALGTAEVVGALQCEQLSDATKRHKKHKKVFKEVFPTCLKTPFVLFVPLCGSSTVEVKR
jgi:sugar (pentulose or hexulose) kinase